MSPSYLHPFRRSYRANHISRAYSRRWREADRAELPHFVAIVNSGGNDFWQVYEYPRRGEIIVTSGAREYRGRIKTGTATPITAEDVEAFDYRLV